MVFQKPVKINRTHDITYNQNTTDVDFDKLISKIIWG